MAKNDTTLIYNEAKVSEGKDLLAGIRKVFIEVDNNVYDGINKISAAKGIENVTSADYSIDLKKPTTLVDQSRTDLKRIIDTLDEQIRLIDKFMNPQDDSTANTPINTDKDNNIENSNKDTTYTKNQLLGIEDIPAEDAGTEEITEKVTGTDPTTDETKKVKIDMPNKNEETVINPNVTTDVPTDSGITNNTNTTTTTTDTNTNKKVDTTTTINTNTNVNVEPEVIVNPTNETTNTVVTPDAPTQTTVISPGPVYTEPSYTPQNEVVNTTPVNNTPPVNNTNTTVSNPTSTETTTGTSTKVSTPKTETTTKVSTPKVSSINSKNASVVPVNTSRDTQTENRVKTDTKKESYTAVRHDGLDKKVVAGAIGGAALLGAVGIGVVAGATKKKEKDTDENFNDGNNYYPTDENYNPN